MTTAARPFLRLTATLSLLALAALFLASCNAGGGGHRRDADGNLVPTARELDPASTFYSDIVEQAEKGNCAETLPALTCFSWRGHGYEGAQTMLGQCLIRGGKAGEGVTWLKRAADAGWPDAQKILARLYLDGKGVPQDNTEAGLWAGLYAKNPSLLSLGVQPDTKLAEKIREALSADERTEARRRAGNWSPAYWQPTDQLDAKTASTCRVRTRKIPQKPSDAIIPSADSGAF